ncbi:MAG: HAD-IA family hydrolase [Bacteroidales bacterium]|nr:HAD-IA family hydrolase [Bacteroidales bacterium]
MPLEKKADAYRKLFPSKKLVLWDLDGTLIDTLEDLAAAVNHALALRGLPLHGVADYRKMVGHGVRNLVKQALEAAAAIYASADQAAEGNYFSGRCPKNQFPSAIASPTLADAYIDAALEDFKEYYKAHIDVHTRPYPGMQELLTELQGQGVKMAVVSNKFQEGTEHLVREFFPDIQFVAILGNKPGFPLKPDPAIVREVLEKAGVNKEDAIMVGDSPTDMRTAAGGGIEAVAVSWGYRTAEELAGAGVAAEADTWPNTEAGANSGARAQAGTVAKIRIVNTVEELRHVLRK